MGRFLERPRPSRALTPLLAFALVILWAVAAFRVWTTIGLFSWLGIDFGLYLAAAQAFVAGDTRAILDVTALRHYVEPLGAYYSQPGPPLQVGPTPYLPVILLIAPLTFLSPPLAFAVWTLANLALAALLVHDLCSRFERPNLARTIAVLAFMPLGYTLFVGQPVILLTYGLYRGYQALQRRQDVRAGLWLGVLLLKPQYALFLILVLLYKRRWHALAGIGAAGAAIALVSIAMIGVDGIPAYVEMMRYASGFREVDPIVNAREMISWRGLLVSALPEGVGDGQGSALTLALSALSALTLVPIWRGRWEPRAASFAHRMLATIIVTLLASFHSHIHGASLLVVPALALASQGGGPKLVQSAMRLAAVVPLFVFVPTLASGAISFVFIVLMLLVLVSTLLFEMRATCVQATIDRPRNTPITSDLATSFSSV